MAAVEAPSDDSDELPDVAASDWLGTTASDGDGR